MHKYYLFLIKNDSFISYYYNSDILYKTLENIFNIKKKNMTYALSIYHQLCNPFNKSIIKSYFDNNNYLKNGKKIFAKENNEKYIIEIRHSCIIIYSRKLPQVFKFLNYYYPTIFVCDFAHKDYFWNKDNYKNIFKQKQYN